MCGVCGDLDPVDSGLEARASGVSGVLVLYEENGGGRETLNITADSWMHDTCEYGDFTVF